MLESLFCGKSGFSVSLREVPQTGDMSTQPLVYGTFAGINNNYLYTEKATDGIMGRADLSTLPDTLNWEIHDKPTTARVGYRGVINAFFDFGSQDMMYWATVAGGSTSAGFAWYSPTQKSHYQAKPSSGNPAIGSVGTNVGLNQILISSTLYFWGGSSSTSNVASTMKISYRPVSSGIFPSTDYGTIIDAGAPPLMYQCVSAYAYVAGAYQIYQFGGLLANQSSGDCSTAVYRFNLTTKRWTRLTDMPYGMRLTNAVVIGKYAYIVGGAGNSSTSKPMRKVLRYHLETFVSEVADLPEEYTVIYGQQCFVYGGKIYSFCGETASGTNNKLFEITV